jgi:hypothetical protein
MGATWKVTCSFIPRWIDVQEPWDSLDDDGEEEAFDDSVSVICCYFVSTPLNYAVKKDFRLIY